MPVRVGEDWKAGLLWRALWDAGVFTNVAVHPAVPPGGALLRTSVMATHDDAGLDARSRPSRASSASSRPSTGRCRARRLAAQLGTGVGRASADARGLVQYLHKSWRNEKRRSERMTRAARLTARRAAA